MAALNFPDSPTLNQPFADWYWDGTKWMLISGTSARSTVFRYDDLTGVSTETALPFLAQYGPDLQQGVQYRIELNGSWRHGVGGTGSAFLRGYDAGQTVALVNSQQYKTFISNERVNHVASAVWTWTDADGTVPVMAAECNINTGQTNDVEARWNMLTFTPISPVQAGPVIGAWQSLTPYYQNNWEDYGGNYQTGQFRLNGDRVELRGLIKTTTSVAINDIIALLPVGYRPPNAIEILNTRISLPSDGGETNDRLVMHVDGGLRSSFAASTPSTQNWVSISDLSWTITP